MKNSSICSKIFYPANFFILILFITYCAKEKQIQEIDKLSGLDGSFEIRDSGFSIKWKINDALLKNKDARLYLDKNDKKEGSQSLKLQADQTAGSGQNPGIGTLLAVMPGKMYKLSFWLKNDAGFSVNWKSLTGSEDQPGRLGVSAKGEQSIMNWTAFADTISIVPGENTLLLEFLLTKPGELWIDNVMFEETLE
jgi:hypothetical protein